MKKNTILYILLVFLIVVNGFFVFNYLRESNIMNEKGGKDPMSFVMQQLNFNTLQVEKMESINKEHHQNMMVINNDLKELKDSLFNNLSNTSIDKEAIDSISTLIGEKQKTRELEAFYHFRSIQELCNDKQKEKFKKIIKDALRNGDNENRPPHPEGQKGPNGLDGHRPPPPNGI